MNYRYPAYDPGMQPMNMYMDDLCGKLAEAYIPYQRYTVSFSPMEALQHGTMFPELVKPYGKGKNGGGM